MDKLEQAIILKTNIPGLSINIDNCNIWIVIDVENAHACIGLIDDTITDDTVKKWRVQLIKQHLAFRDSVALPITMTATVPRPVVSPPPPDPKGYVTTKPGLFPNKSATTPYMYSKQELSVQIDGKQQSIPLKNAKSNEGDSHGKQNKED